MRIKSLIAILGLALLTTCSTSCTSYRVQVRAPELYERYSSGDFDQVPGIEIGKTSKPVFQDYSLPKGGFGL